MGYPSRASKLLPIQASFPPTEGECFRLCVRVIHCSTIHLVGKQQVETTRANPNLEREGE